MKRKPIEIKKRIFQILRAERTISVNKLQRKINTNYTSVMNNCEELEYLGFVRISKTNKDSRNGRPYLIVSLVKTP